MEETEKIEAVREAALRILDRGDKTVSELRKKLEEKGCGTEYTDIVMDSLQRAGLVDDSRYARLYIRSKLESGKGFIWIKKKLAEKGVSTDVINNAVDDVRSSGEAGADGFESERTLCLRKALALAGLSADFEIDENGEVIYAEGSLYEYEPADVFGRRAEQKIKKGALEADKRVIYKEREKAKASLMRRLASAGFAAGDVINAVKIIEKL